MCQTDCVTSVPVVSSSVPQPQFNLYTSLYAVLYCVNNGFAQHFNLVLNRCDLLVSCKCARIEKSCPLFIIVICLHSGYIRCLGTHLFFSMYNCNSVISHYNNMGDKVHLNFGAKLGH